VLPIDIFLASFVKTNWLNARAGPEQIPRASMHSAQISWPYFCFERDREFRIFLKERLVKMKNLKEVMSANVQVVGPEATLHELAAKMQELDSGAIPVCDGDRLCGMVTDRDIVLKTFAAGRDPSTLCARDVMSSPIVYCFEDQDIGEAARIMEAKKIRRLVVLDKNKRLVGIVSLGDISLRSGSEDISYEILEKVSEPSDKTAAA
jgi:CBS domain-containing protein